MEVSDVFRGFRNGTFALNGSKFIRDFLNKIVFKILRRRSVFPRPLGRGHVHACTITFLFRSRDRWVKKVVFFFKKRKKTCFEFTFLLLFVWVWICRKMVTIFALVPDEGRLKNLRNALNVLIYFEHWFWVLWIAGVYILLWGTLIIVWAWNFAGKPLL